MSLARGSALFPGLRWLIASLAVVASLTAAGRAEAGLLVDTDSRCADQELERPFLPWLDPAYYTLVPDGSFSKNARGWSRSQAKVVEENEPWNVARQSATAALRVNAGGSATSPAMCVGIGHPTLRFFARNEGSSLDRLDVDVLFEDAGGNVRSLRIWSVTGHSRWSPTLPVPILVNLLPLLPGEQTPVAFRFSSPDSGSAWTIDDVYVDPYKKG